MVSQPRRPPPPPLALSTFLFFLVLAAPLSPFRCSASAPSSSSPSIVAIAVEVPPSPSDARDSDDDGNGKGGEGNDVDDECLRPRHFRLSVGRDPSTSMTVSFTTTFSDRCRSDRGTTALIVLGTDPRRLNRTVRGEDPPRQYNGTYPTSGGGEDLSSSFLFGETEQRRRRRSGQAREGKAEERGEVFVSDLFHHVRVNDLEPDTLYYYKCEFVRSMPEAEDVGGAHRDDGIEAKPRRGRRRQMEGDDSGNDGDDDRDNGSSFNGSFRTAPSPGATCGKVKFAILGDVGITDNAVKNVEAILREETSPLSSSSSSSLPVSAVFLAGDISYANTDKKNCSHKKWDVWFDKMSPLLNSKPLQIAPGNHDGEIDLNDRRIFVAYENRFAMPKQRDAVTELSPTPGHHGGSLPYPLTYEYGNSYYSFVYGPATIIFLNSYASSKKGSVQYNWLEGELKSVDRTVTPWLFAVFHAPFYNTFTSHRDDVASTTMKKHMEPLFVKYGVNVVFSGHVHAYMRTKPVAFEKVDETSGPTYVIVGDGGEGVRGNYYSTVPERWVEARDGTSTGYGTISIANETHARWDWVRTTTTTAEAEEGEGDGGYFVNRYFARRNRT